LLRMLFQVIIETNTIAVPFPGGARRRCSVRTGPTASEEITA